MSLPLSLKLARHPRTIFEVGAYTGNDALIDLCRRRGHRLFMFEPNPRRFEEIRAKAADAPTVVTLPCAVSNYDGRARLKIANFDDCSSLSDFDPGANEAWVHPWHPYKRFDMVDEVDVEVRRLDRLMEEHGVAVVDFLEIDAQGEDLRIVEGLGERVADVRRIQIECNVHASPLYASSFTRREAVDFFARAGFDPHVWWKQSMGREENIVFRNRRFHPHRVLNVLTSAVEQVLHRAYFAWLKLPRVLAVTRDVVKARLGGAPS